jgi:hypothetical protein
MDDDTDFYEKPHAHHSFRSEKHQCSMRGWHWSSGAAPLEPVTSPDAVKLLSKMPTFKMLTSKCWQNAGD